MRTARPTVQSSSTPKVTANGGPPLVFRHSSSVCRVLEVSATPNTDRASDQDLIAAINRGDAAAFEALYYRYRDWVVRLAYRFTGDRDAALDVLQDTFAYLLGKFPRFRLTSRMTTFLYPVVRNISISVRRKAIRFVSNEDALLDAAAEESGDRLASRSELAAALASLPEAQREVLLMRYVDDFTLQEIADILRIPLGTVKSRIHNALRTLRDDDRTREYFEA